MATCINFGIRVAVTENFVFPTQVKNFHSFLACVASTSVRCFTGLKHFRFLDAQELGRAQKVREGVAAKKRTEMPRTGGKIYENAFYARQEFLVIHCLFNGRSKHEVKSQH